MYLGIPFWVPKGRERRDRNMANKYLLNALFKKVEQTCEYCGQIYSRAICSMVIFNVTI